MHHFCGNNTQAGIFKMTINFNNDVLGKSIGFDNRNGTLNSH